MCVGLREAEEEEEEGAAVHVEARLLIEEAGREFTEFQTFVTRQ